MNWNIADGIGIRMLVLLAAVLLLFGGCNPAEQIYYGDDQQELLFRVTLWGDNGPVHQWISRGRPLSESEGGPGYYFLEANTNLFIKVSGNISVEQLEVGLTLENWARTSSSSSVGSSLAPAEAEK